MLNNIRIASELVKIAKSLVSEETNLLDKAANKGKKYILHHRENGLWRIQACKNFGDVHKGDFGGLVESEDNLSHSGDCWVYRQAKVYGDAEVFASAKVYGSAEVYGRAEVYGDAKVYGDAEVYGDAQIYENAKVYSSALVHGKVRVHGKARVNYDADEGDITE